MHDQLAERLGRQPFEPFRLRVTDGRLIDVREPSQAVLNSLAISVVEAAFSVTVIGLSQIAAVEPLVSENGPA